MSTMEFDLNEIQAIGLNTETGLGYTGSREKYVSALQRFFKNYEKNRTAVEESFAAEDLENYMITVHALKSNAKMLGAMALSKDFETLEIAAREKDTATVKEKTAAVMADYAALIEKLRPIGEMAAVHAADEISGAAAKETADQLLEALEDFDDDASKELAKKLSGYPFRTTQKDLLKKAMDFIDDFMYEEAEELIREIYPEIEQDETA